MACGPMGRGKFRRHWHWFNLSKGTEVQYECLYVVAFLEVRLVLGGPLSYSSLTLEKLEIRAPDKQAEICLIFISHREL